MTPCKHCIKIDYNDSGMTVAREVEGGQVETFFAVSTPVVIGAHKSLNNPRYASLPGIMKAKRKPFQKITLEELDLNPSELAANVHTKAIKFNYPPEKPKEEWFKESLLSRWLIKQWLILKTKQEFYKKE